MAGCTNLFLKLKKLKTAIFYLTSKKKKKLLIEKKNKEENEIEYNCWCNRDKIEKMTEQIFNWKVNLVFLKIIFIDFHF